MAEHGKRLGPGYRRRRFAWRNSPSGSGTNGDATGHRAVLDICEGGGFGGADGAMGDPRRGSTRAKVNEGCRVNRLCEDARFQVSVCSGGRLQRIRRLVSVPVCWRAWSEREGEEREAVKRLQEAAERASAWIVISLKRAVNKTV